MLEIEGLSQVLRRRARGRRREPRRPSGRDPRAHRPQRRGQDDAVQHAHRPAPARCRRRVRWKGERLSGLAAARGLAARGRPHLSDHRDVRLAQRARQRARRAAVATRGRTHALARRGAQRLEADGGPRAARPGRARRAGGASGRRARVRRSEAARAGGRARQRARAAPARRADGRHGARRARRADGARRPASRASAGSPCSSPSTTWTWCSRSPTASWCSTRGA